MGAAMACRVDSRGLGSVPRRQQRPRQRGQCRCWGCLFWASSGSRVLWLDKQVSYAVSRAEGWVYKKAPA